MSIELPARGPFAGGTRTAAALLLASLTAVSCGPGDADAGVDTRPATTPTVAVAPEDHPPASRTAADQAPSTDDRPGDEDPSALRARFQDLWTARQAEDWAAVFRFQDPRAVPDATVEEFVAWAEAQEPFGIESFEILQASADGNQGWVEVTCSASMRRYPNLPAREVTRWEKWWRVEDQWYPVPPSALDQVPASPSLRDPLQEARLLARFEESWEARRMSEWDTLIEMMAPNDQPTDPTALEQLAETEEFFGYLTCDIRWVEVQGETGIVRAIYTHKVNDPSMTKLPPKTVAFNEPWVSVDGEWYIDLIPQQN